jgi:Protein of unknown function (DUF998)
VANDRVKPRLLELSILASLWFLGTNIVLTLLNPELNPVSVTISEYALGQYGWWMSFGILIHGLGNTAFSLYFFNTTRNIWFKILLVVWAVGTILAGLFTVDKITTLAGFLHTAGAALSFLCVALISFWLSRKIQLVRPRTGSLLLAISVAAVVSLSYIFWPSQYQGLGEKIFVFLIIVWEISVAFLIRKQPLQLIITN